MGTMQTVANWIQALATTAIAVLTVWVIFVSDAGELATELLRSELRDAKQEVKSIENERAQLAEEKKRLQIRTNDLRREKEEHVDQVVNARLGELWLRGVRAIGTYREVAKAAAELVETWKCAEERRISAKTASGVKPCKLPSVERMPSVEDNQTEERSEWGALRIDWSGLWECSTNAIFFGKDNENNDTQVGTTLEDNHRRENEREIACFGEWEQTLRNRVEAPDGQEAMSVKHLARQLIETEEVTGASESVKRKISARLFREIELSDGMANMPIEVKVPPGASREEMVRQGKRIVANTERARQWLDRATRGRKQW